MDKPRVEVAIIGGGLGGVALAVGLHQRGIEAHVFEKAAGLNSDTGTAISLGRNATTALDGIREGLSDKIKAAASITKTTKATMCKEGQEPMVVLREYNSGEKEDDELYLVKWRSARNILATQIPASYIHCSHKLVGYSTSAADGVSVELKFETGKNEEVVFLARFVVGADGINSAVRKIMVGDEPRDLHLLNWNALVYNPGVFHVHDKDQIVLTRCGPTLCFLVDAGEDYTMWVFRVEDRSGAGSKTGKFGDASVKSRVLKEVDKLIASCEAWKPLRVAVEATGADNIFERRMRDRKPLTSWSDLNQRVLLIGDAAHAMHSGPGQGARTAFEDAHQLSELLSAAYAAGGSDEELNKAVTRFEELRIPRLTKCQKYAAETTGLPEFIPDWVKQLTPTQSMIRMSEFQRWVSSYPKKMTGDPESTYFK